jgi:hypothetical protein
MQLIPTGGTHCNENPIYVFLFWELRGLSPNFHIHVSGSDLYIPRMGPHTSCSRIGRFIVGIQYIKSSVAAKFLFWEYLLPPFGIGSLQYILF